MEKKSVLSGYSIVIADRGFVYVGKATWDGDFCTVEDARNVRIWGTTKGLGELALNGPTSKTVLDDVGTARIPCPSVISMLDTETKLWTGK